MTPITVERLEDLMAALRPNEQPSMRRSREGCVEGAIGNAVLAAGYAAQEGDEPDILHVAAYLMRSLARLHCYTDGNKRIAWLATLDVLAVHTATTLEVDQDEAAETVVAVATGVMGIPDLCTWLAEHLVPLT